MSDTRPSFPSIFMTLAHELAKRSTCTRLAVGAVITSVDWRYVYGVGYNGQAAGVSHMWTPNKCTGEKGRCGCLHAEENAIINCNAPRDVGKNMICTHFPCIQCAKRLVNLGGVQTVYYAQPYGDMKHSVELFERAGIYLRKV